MTKNKKASSSDIRSKAAKILKDPKTSQIQKKLAGSALSQSDPNKQTGSEMEEIAAQVLQGNRYSDTTKSLAGSVLSQAAIQRLPDGDIRELTTRPQAYLDDMWDRQLESDLESGKLDTLIARAEKDIATNRVRDLDEVLYNL